MSDQRRNSWPAKHKTMLRTYRAYCGGCEIDWEFEASVSPKEVYCPFCSDDEPIKVEEAKANG